jgi:hypothetical protein
MYKPGGPTIINLLDGNRELSYFYNHTAQTDFLSAIEQRGLTGKLSDEALDCECRALLRRQWKGDFSFLPPSIKRIEYKPDKRNNSFEAVK